MNLTLLLLEKTVVKTGSGKLGLDRSRAWIEIMGKSDIVPVLVSNS
ncbi:hypothetical protein QPL79_00815 [Ignisphaera sp. 4213-co]|uniref:Uncharacterized protein n=1 Tax=Ignisphaera cupida TaxID=3050454 RepID=A0ABD4Z710_9CREN|nr:hypothetical protein [Ignisphaera sp. 4213-co]MDK6027908.1 hypothetical protein [Ignisphaera sp. 4213-co]